MQNLPSMNGLKAFESAARHLSFKSAADELFVTPAAISNQIKKLEESLGVRLFQRLNRKVELTDTGEKLLIRMRIIFDDIREATHDIVQKNEETVVTIAIPPALLNYWLIPNLSIIHGCLPNINLRLIDPIRSVDIAKEHIDVAIHYGFSSKNTSDHLLTEELVPVCSPKLLINNELSRPEDLVNFRLIYTEKCLVEWDNYFIAGAYQQFNIGKKLWFLNTTHTLKATLKGLGVALINPMFISEYLKNGELIIPFKWNINLSNKPNYYFVTNELSEKKREILLLRKTLIKLASDTNKELTG